MADIIDLLKRPGVCLNESLKQILQSLKLDTTQKKTKTEMQIEISDYVTKHPEDAEKVRKLANSFLIDSKTQRQSKSNSSQQTPSLTQPPSSTSTHPPPTPSSPPPPPSQPSTQTDQLDSQRDLFIISQDNPVSIDSSAMDIDSIIDHNKRKLDLDSIKIHTACNFLNVSFYHNLGTISDKKRISELVFVLEFSSSFQFSFLLVFFYDGCGPCPSFPRSPWS